MGKFNLNDILNNASLAEAGAKRKTEEKKEVIIELDLYDLIPSADNFYDVSNLSDLIETIPVVGVLQPILVKPSDEEPGKYHIIAGHRRREACKYLVEKRYMESCRKMPCIIKEGDESAEDSDIINKLTLILSNRYRDITDYEKMTEVIELEKILDEARERESVRGVLQSVIDEIKTDEKKIKSRDILAAFAGISSTQVGRYKAIYNNLCFDLMMAFKNNRINVSVAYEASGLSESYQNKAVEFLRNDSQLTISHIQGLKQKEKDSTPIKGQQTLTEVVNPNRPLRELVSNPSTMRTYVIFFRNACMKEYPEVIENIENEKNDLNHISKQLILDNWLPIETEDFIIQHDKLGYKMIRPITGETFTMCIYDFWKYYEEEFIGCNEQLPIPVPVRKAEKTEEQLYDERQKKIDKETKEKLALIREEEQYEAHQQEEKRNEDPKTYDLDFSVREFSNIYYGGRSFLILVDKGYRKDDKIIMHRMVKGERDEYRIETKVKEVIKDCTGIEDKYCILVLSILRRSDM